MKILFLTVNMGAGGAEKVLVNLANGLAERGHDITVRALTDTGTNIRGLSSNVRYEALLKRSFPGLGRLHRLPHRAIYSLVCSGCFDVIIPYVHGTLTRIVSYGPEAQKKVAWLHADMEKSPFMQQLLKDGDAERCFKSYDRVIACSETVKTSFIKSTGITENVRVLYNTFNVDEILSLAAEKENIVSRGKGIQLISVGKLEEVKGYRRLLKVLDKLVNEDGYDVKLTLVGEGSERKQLEQYISELGLSERVTLIGFDPNPYKYIANSDLFICSSYSEGFSSVVAESLILGIPVVTTECSGMREMLGENEYGIITSNDEDGLYEGIKRALGDLAFWREKACERRDFFSVEETVGAVADMLGELVHDEK